MSLGDVSGELHQIGEDYDAVAADYADVIGVEEFAQAHLGSAARHVRDTYATSLKLGSLLDNLIKTYRSLDGHIDHAVTLTSLAQTTLEDVQVKRPTATERNTQDVGARVLQMTEGSHRDDIAIIRDNAQALPIIEEEGDKTLAAALGATEEAQQSARDIMPHCDEINVLIGQLITAVHDVTIASSRAIDAANNAHGLTQAAIRTDDTTRSNIVQQAIDVKKASRRY